MGQITRSSASGTIRATPLGACIGRLDRRPEPSSRHPRFRPAGRTRNLFERQGGSPGSPPGELVRPPPVRIGRFRYRTGFVARRAAEDLPPSGRWNRPCATPRAAGIRERAPAEQTQAPASGLAPPGVLVARPAEPAYEMNAVQTESVIPLATPGCRASPRGHVCPSPKMPFSTSLYGGLRAGGRRRPYGAPSLNPKC